jgi:arabinofuranan 3-O-arabinosyltransferase
MTQGPLTEMPESLLPLLDEDAAPDLSTGHERATPSHADWIMRRYPELLVTIVMTSLVFLQHPGRIVRDTKLDLAIDPGRFLASVTHLWDAQIAFGSVPDQAYGYLFPMGPFYWLGATLHVPEWIVQRTWLAALLSIAFWGTVKMAEVFGVGTRWTRVAGGVAYALSPWVLAQAHDTSYILPGVLLPWVMIPLKRAADGKLTARAAALRSGVAVLLMGGINATLTLAALLLPVIWFASQRPLRRQVRLFGLWCVAVFLATAWFIVPLLFQGRYGFDFLPYTETAATTTATSSVADVLRGGGIWTSFGSAPLWSPAGLLLETGSFVIAASALVLGLGLFGLARRDMPHRVFLVLSVVVGTAIVCAGYDGHLGSPLAAPYQVLLNGGLAAFRNVYKFQPVILLPLSLGVIHALARAVEAARGPAGAWRAWIFGAVAVAFCGVLTLAAAPLVTAQIYPQGSFTAIPTYYGAASAWVNARGATSNTLVLPGTDFSRFTWGDTLDNPMQVLATVPWANRNVVPLGSVGNTQVLDAVDEVLADGQPAPGLAGFLARAGVRYLVVENDLNPMDANHPTPALIRLVLSSEPGIRRVARFGPVISHENSGFLADDIVDPTHATTNIRAVEIYEVMSPRARTPLVTTYPNAAGVAVSGGPQALLALANGRELGDEAVALSGDPLGPTFRHTRWVDTDTQQVRATILTALYDNQSAVMTAQQAESGAVAQFVVVPGIEHQTVSRLDDVSVSASSYGSQFSAIPGDQPLMAFLNDAPGASWVPTAADPAPWIEISFPRAISIASVSVTPSVQRNQSVITDIRVSTDSGTISRTLAPRAVPQTIALRPGKTRMLRISLEGVQHGKNGKDSPPGLRHISIPGITATQTLVAPADPPAHLAASPMFLFSSPIPDQFEVFRSPDDEPQMDRTFNVPPGRGGGYLISGQVTPVRGATFPSADLAAPFTLGCGAGPTFVLDGTVYQTTVTGTVGDLDARRPLKLLICPPGPSVDLQPGPHTITTSDPSGQFKVTGLAVVGSFLPAGAQPRSVSVDQWGNETRSLTVSPGAGAILDVRQNYNPGWVATVGGRTLHPLRVDGWQQGWELPASDSSEEVHLAFTPDGIFRGSLLIGAVLALLLVVAAAATLRRRTVVPVADMGRQGPAHLVSARARHSAHGASLATLSAMTVAAAGVLFLVGGPFAGGVALLLGILGVILRRRSWLAWLALGAGTMAGVAMALDPGYRIGVWVGSGSYAAQGLAIVALAALTVSLLPDRRTREGG